VVKALRRAGFEQTHVRGSHHYLRRPDGGGLVVVPVHGNRATCRPARYGRSCGRQI
jgi:predicted RNA binding protein YcfA (HicA-like mRNA interferase family)